MTHPETTTPDLDFTYSDRPEIDPEDMLRQFMIGESMPAIANRYRVRHSEVEAVIRFALKHGR